MSDITELSFDPYIVSEAFYCTDCNKYHIGVIRLLSSGVNYSELECPYCGKSTVILDIAVKTKLFLGLLYVFKEGYKNHERWC